MIDPANTGVIAGRLVADPEIINGKIVKFSVAKDYAGTDSTDSDNKTGFFDVVYYLNDGDMNSKFVEGQLRDKKMGKGSSLSLVYSLQHQRWETDGSRRSKIVLVAQSIAYTQGGRPREDGETNTSKGRATTTSSAPAEF